MAIHFPVINSCCGCVTDLKCAAAIIAVFGIVTSPALSWAIVRHSYVIRMSCFITTSESRADIIDINLNNVLSFGFGANAGLTPSCLGKVGNQDQINDTFSQIPARKNENSVFVETVKIIGWLVLLADLVFFGTSLSLLYRLFHAPEKNAALIFIWIAIVSITLSFIYAMLFVAACISIGGAFPIFEFGFSLIDVCLWVYFLLVVQSYRLKSTKL